MRKRVCNGQVHKVRTDGTKIKCDNGDFKAIKGRKGKAPEDEVNDSKNCDGQSACLLPLVSKEISQIVSHGEIVQDIEVVGHFEMVGHGEIVQDNEVVGHFKMVGHGEIVRHVEVFLLTTLATDRHIFPP